MIYKFHRITDFLEAELSSRTKRNPKYSANAFARDIGISKAYLSLLFARKRRWTTKTVEKVANKLQLPPLEREYFELLSAGETASNSDVKKQIYAHLKSFRESHEYTEIALQKFDVIADWEHSAILEVLLLDNLRPELKAIADKLSLPIKTVEEAIQRLLDLGLVKKQGKKIIRVEKSHLSTPHDVSNAALKKFHRQTLTMAADALDEQDVAERQISGITMAINPTNLPQAKKRIREFMRSLSTELSSGQKTEIYQMTFSLFKLQNKRGKT